MIKRRPYLARSTRTRSAGGCENPTITTYDDRMKRITVSLPDDLADRVKQAAGGNVSAYVVAALQEYGERESLDEILADWERATPVPDEVVQRIEAEFDRIGMIDKRPERRAAG